MPKPEERPEKPVRQRREVRPAALGRAHSKPGRRGRTLVHRDWPGRELGLPPTEFCEPEAGDPAEDGSQCPALRRQVFVDHEEHDLRDLSPDGRRIRMIVVRFQDGTGAPCLPDSVPHGMPFRFRVEGGKVVITPAPDAGHVLEVVCEGDTLPAPAEPVTEPELPEAG